MNSQIQYDEDIEAIDSDIRTRRAEAVEKIFAQASSLPKSVTVDESGPSLFSAAASGVRTSVVKGAAKGIRTAGAVAKAPVDFFSKVWNA